MKKIISMVGTSIYENYLEKNDNSSVKNYLKDLENKKADEFDSQKERIKKIKEALKEWIKKERDSENLSAEIKSIVRLKEELKDNFEIHLLCSDTVLSKLAAELIRDILPNLINNHDEVKVKIVEDLQIWDRKKFIEGMVRLIRSISGIANDFWRDVVINITGGFKATIPYLTILAQINKCEIYYIFEKTDALIKIPYVPLDIRWEIFEKYQDLFYKLEKEEVSEIKNVKADDLGDIESLLERADNLYSLNPLGVALWERYKQRFEVFYISDLFNRHIQKDKQYTAIAEKSLLELKRRIVQNSQHPDLDHKLTDVDLQGFKCFKHKVDNLQVRVLYKIKERETMYGSKEFDIYASLICIGNDVHNVESEYIEDFKKNLEKIKDLSIYKTYTIEKQEV